MGSEMCIRDSIISNPDVDSVYEIPLVLHKQGLEKRIFMKLGLDCLLYTSDAADERSSVDLGGRRLIKKKKHDVS